MSDTISYDVFDTVVTRVFAHPRDLFVRLGESAEGRLGGVTPLQFAQARWKAELAIRQRTLHREVKLEEIYAQLGRDLRWDEATCRELQNLELELESRSLRAVPGIAEEIAAARREAGRILFLSDMYLPSPILGEWMLRLGVLAPGDRLFISGEMRGNKSSGRLYALARDETGASYGSWRHAGDHAFADVEMPRRLGLKASHRPRVHLTPREKLLRGSNGEFSLPWRSLLAGAARLARLECASANAREERLWSIATAVAGPLFYGFVRWTLEEAERRGLQRLYFLARDGQILWRIAQEIQGRRSGAIDCRYLHVSRLVLAGPTEVESSAAFRELTAPQGGFHSLRQALLHVGLEVTDVELPSSLAGRDPDSNLPPDAREAIGEWLWHPQQRPQVTAALARRHRQTRAYLAAEGLDDDVPFGVVDTGWLGTSQKNLERILSAAGSARPLTGFYLGLLPPRPPAAAGTMLGYTNHFRPLPLMRDESHKVLIELMAQSDHGQVAGFKSENGNWSPVLRDPGPVDLSEIRGFQKAVLAFVRRALDSEKESSAPAAEYARVVIENYCSFQRHPSAEEAATFGRLPHADQVFEQSHACLCAPMTTREVLRAMADFRCRPPHWWLEGQATYGHGLLLRTFRALKRWRWRLTGRAE